MFTQLDAKPVVKQKYLKHNKPKERTCGIGRKKCKLCGRTGAYVGKYKLGFCRQCFRDYAKELGFKKYS